MKIMKKMLALMLVLMISLSTILTVLPLAVSAVVDEKDYNTSIPTFWYDFSDSMKVPFGVVDGATIERQEGYYSITPKTLDPQANMALPKVTMDQMLYANFIYRINAKGNGRMGEIYYSASNGESFGEQTKMKWTWSNTSGEWTSQVVHMTSFDGKNGVRITGLRFDPLAFYSSGILADEKMDIKCIAFFANESDAKRFNLDEYARYLKDLKQQQLEEENKPHIILPGDFTVPEPAAVKHYSAEDNAEGSFKMTHNEDGTLTVSYTVNGKTNKYTVPDTAENARGPLAGTDDLGRTLWNQFTVVDPDYTKISGPRNADGEFLVDPVTVDKKPFTVGVSGSKNREIGIFYWIWHGVHGDTGIHDITKIIEKYGEAEAKKGKSNVWTAGVGENYFFAEPLYGYYYAGDQWVMRKHMELLANAGIDFLYFDTTNGVTYSETAIEVMAICHDLNKQGIKAPKVCFYTHDNPGTNSTVKRIYDDIYSNNLFPDTWYYFDGKPLIIATDAAQANINDFFTVKEAQWPNEEDTQKDNAFPWIDWNWPQKQYFNGRIPEVVNVSVAQHAGNSIFSSALFGYKGNWGRSFNGSNALLTDDSYKLGLNLQNQFNYAMSVNTPIVSVTGWNEWTAVRLDSVPNIPVVFIDTFNLEYSRDIEMTRGGYFDNYYMQLVSNIRGIKGSEPTLVQDGRNYIDVTGSFDQWKKIPVTYVDPEGDADDRDAVGFGQTVYSDITGRNDITSIKVTGDTTYLYLYMSTADTIQRSTSSKTPWMQIYLDVDSDGKTGWYGYDFIVNSKPDSDTVTHLAKFSGNGTKHTFETVNDIEYRVYGNEIMFAVPLEYLGITSCDRLNIQFKGVDSKVQVKEMEDFYTHGDTAPLGRPNFVYQTYIPGVTEGEGMAVVPLEKKLLMNGENPGVETTEENTTGGNAGDVTTAADTTDASDENRGCKSLLSVSLLPLMIVAVPAVMLKKRKEN